MQALREEPVLHDLQIGEQAVHKVGEVLLRNVAGFPSIAIAIAIGWLEILRGDFGAFGGERAVLEESRGRHRVHDRLPQDRIRPRILPEIRDQILQNGQLLVQSGTAVRRHVVAHDGAVAPPLGDDGFRRVVGRVQVHVGQVSEEDVAPGEACVAHWGAGEPLDRPVRAKVHHSVRFKALLEPRVEGGVLGVRGEVPLEEQPHGVALHPQQGLHADPDVAELEAADDVHALAGDTEVAGVAEIAPLALELAREDLRVRQERDGPPLGGSPARGEGQPFPELRRRHLCGTHSPTAERLRHRLPKKALHGRPATRDGPRIIQRPHHLENGVAVDRIQINAAHVVALCPKLLEQRDERVRDIQERGRARGAHAGREAVEEDSHLALAVLLAPEGHPLVQARGEALHPLGNEINVVVDESADGNSVDGAVQLWERVQDDRLEAGHATSVPALQVLDQQGRGHHVRNVLGLEDLPADVALAPRLHRAGRSAHQREADRRHDGIDLRKASLEPPPIGLGLALGRQEIPHHGVRLHPIDEDGHGHQAVLLEAANELRNVLLLRQHVLPVQ
mmetsp:Transcript_30510/g.65297  ORF Transcript_30510/g.65297 Transcript_30510/m.65297 type:complete len:563 (-) Transcript_30510:97-1785(-)